MALNINGGLILNSGSLNTIQTPRSSVIYDSGLSFSASVDNVELVGNTFSVTSSIITLDTADTTYDRVDAIVAELSSSVGPRITKVTGTPSAEAAFPILDLSNQIALKYVTVKANATTPSSAGTDPFDQETPEDFETVLVYNEGTNLPEEWITGSTTQWLNDIPGNTYQSTEEAYAGSYSVKNNLNRAQTGGLSGQYISPYFRYPIQEGNQIQAKRVAGISFYIKLKTKLTASQPKLIAQFNFSNLSGLGYTKSLGTNNSFENFGIDINNTTDWQWVALSIDDFVSGTNENPNHVLTSLFLGAKGGVLTLPNDAFVYLDYIQLHLGSLPASDPNNGGTGGNTASGTGVYKQGDTNFSIIPTNALSCVTNDFSTIGGGQNNTITGSQYSYIGAGQNNIIESGSDYISILGGAYNTASADYSSVIGGCANINNGIYSSIAGGRNNSLTTNTSAIVGGQNNTVEGSGAYIFLGGGVNNYIYSSTNQGHVIVGGSNNISSNGLTSGGHTIVVGGCKNCTTGNFSSIVGGTFNTGSGRLGFIGGGNCNYITNTAHSSSIVGGFNNTTTYSNTHILGSNLTADKACYTFMNNLDVAGVVSGSTFSGSFVGDGSGLTNIPTSSIVNFPTEVSRSAAAAGFGSGGVTELPVGGTTGQSLVKNSDTDYDVTWSTVSGGGGNGEYVPYITGSSSSGILPRLGSNCTTIDNFATIAGGRFNNVVDAYSFIGGGFTNLVSQSYSAILGGLYNEVHTGRSSIVGGCKNCIHTFGSSFIGGGTLNTGSGRCSAIVGGENNTNAATHGFVGGGNSNTITSAGSCGAILGGKGNCLCNSCSFIIGTNITSSACNTTYVNNLNVEGELSITSLNVGDNDSATLGGEYSSILAGRFNDNDGKWSAIGGGQGHDIANTATGSFIGAGDTNFMDAEYGFIGAGNLNKIWEGNCYNFIGAGQSNNIHQGNFHGILAGRSNKISSSTAVFDAGNTIVGGVFNQILQEVDGSFIGNGCKNVITGSFNFSSIIGGECNTVKTANSHIIGSCITSDKSNYTYVENIHITGSTTTNGILQLTRRETTPTGVEGMIISSGSAGSSKLYYYDGSSWNALF